MHKSIRERHFNPVVRIAPALALLGMLLSTSALAGGNNWGWAKPINKRMGAFYTSNKNANFSRNTRSSSSNYHRQSTHRIVRPSIPVQRHIVQQPVSHYTVQPHHVTGHVIQRHVTGGQHVVFPAQSVIPSAQVIHPRQAITNPSPTMTPHAAAKPVVGEQAAPAAPVSTVQPKQQFWGLP